MPIFSLLELYQDNTPRSAAMNMALDEIFWQTATIPCLRMYEWAHPALSFGYFGRYEEVADYRSERELVRRCTGGGIVLHGSDLTYALVIPAGSYVCEKSSTSVYGVVHEAIKNALGQTGIAATLAKQTGGSGFFVGKDCVAQRATATRAANLNACFANPVPADVLVDGRKVAGAAQRRSRRGLLQQGSIQNIHLPDDFRHKFAHALSAEIILTELDSSLLDQGHRLADTKYQTEAWLRRR